MKTNWTILIVICFLFSCKQTSTTVDELSLDEQLFFTAYVKSYPSGVKSKAAKIKVELEQSLSDRSLEELADIDFLKISPKVKGTINWFNQRSFEFVPEKVLDSGQKYQFKIDLQKLYDDVPSEKRIFAFDIKTRFISLSTPSPNLFPIDDRDPSKMQIEGTVRVSDITDLESVQKTLEATQNRKALEIEWKARDNQQNFEYAIKGVHRGDEQSMVTLSFNGNPVQSESKLDPIEVIIPALDAFEVTSVQVLQKTDQQILLEFSDFLQADQNVKGLIRLSNNAKIRTSIIDNKIKVIPANRQEGSLEVIVDQGIKNTNGKKLKDSFTHAFSFKKLTPQLEALSSGAIMPSSDRGLIFPFKAVGLHAVQVRVIRVYEDNIGQFLQVNNIQESNQLKRVGRMVHKSNVSLGDPKDSSLKSWNNYAIDLTDLMKTEPGALYRIKLSFSRNHAITDCGDDNPSAISFTEIDEDNEFSAYDRSNRYYDDDEYSESYWLRDHDNPCESEYYASSNPHSKPIYQNVIASDLGIIAKKTKNDKLSVAVTNLKSADALSGIDVQLYNHQNRIIQSNKTNGNGFAEFELEGVPLYLIANDGKQKGYLKLDDGSSLSLSTFDVSGGQTQNGIKGYLYEERGVRRPGDSVYVTLILEDKSNPLPDDHPVIFELYDARNQLADRTVVNGGLNNFYAYRAKTDPDAPTGNWKLKSTVGGAKFSKTIKVETVKPNRLKINLDFPGDVLYGNNLKSGVLDVKWLHGAVAKNLKADVEMTMKRTKTRFDKFKDYDFDDVSKDFNTDVSKIFDGKLDASGNATISPKLTVKENAPGMLQAAFKIRAFEEGGNFSVDRFAKTISPFESYVGVKVPKGKGWRDAIFSDETSKFEIATVDQYGDPVKRTDLKVEIYNLKWSWWWERSSRNNIRRYVADRSQNLMQTKVISTNNQGKGVFNFNLGTERYGRTLIKITDPISGHSSAQIFYTTYSRWWDDGGDDVPGAAEMLTFKTNKSAYDVGEMIDIELPSNANGKALVSIENGTEILEKFWVDVKETNGKLSMTATSEMASNAYLNITYIQPHGQVKNDRPIRLYGIQRIDVSDPLTKLEPTLTSPNEIRPETDYEISVKEKTGQPMTYTLAVVDDGLLDLTRFKTPQPWNTFYAREALGVKTWDLFSDVMGAFGGSLTQMLALGGDEFAKGEENAKANRFKPVVQYLGPFELKAGGTAKHTLQMPNYVGSVRAMIVAGNPDSGAYGNSEATIPVRKPLMVVTTMPRVLSPGESLDMPITVFAMDEKVKDVKVTVESNDFLAFEKKTMNLSFSEVGDQVVRLPLSVSDAIGIGKVKVTVSGAGEMATEEIELDVRPPNPEITKVQESIINREASKEITYEMFGLGGTNAGMLELSTIPPLNLEKRLRYLIKYPHGCIEQTTSAAFPQLYLSDVADMTNSQKDNARINVDRAIKRIKKFQQSGGSMSYWPGRSYTSHWGTSYAGHFLLEAKRKGHIIPYGLVENWLKYQSSAARNWSDNEEEHWTSKGNRLTQAYRLYTLALGEKPELGAMNRLRAIDDLDDLVKWKLAGAYALSGKPEVARELIANAKKSIKPYREYAYTYGSDLRDKALILQTLTLIGERDEALKMIKVISEDLSADRWYSTQTTAFCLMTIGRYIESQDESVPMDIDIVFGNGKKADFEMTKPVKLIELSTDLGSQKIQISNNGGKELFARVVLSGIPAAGAETATSSKIALKPIYTDLNGNPIDLNAIPQGSDINISVTVSHKWSERRYFRQLALSQILPAGWEIRNVRMDAADAVGGNDIVEYQDVRDDRVLTYFSLPYGESKTFKLQVNATYAGKYYLPPVQCEAMYDNTINANTKGQWINVVAE